MSNQGEIPMSPYDPNDCYTFLDGLVQGLETNDMQPNDNSRAQEVSCELGFRESGSTPGIRKRGRPRLLVPHGTAAKERRKEQCRIAQQKYRSRKEEKIASSSEQVVRLKQTLLLVHNLYLNMHMLFMTSGFSRQYSPQLKLLQDNLEFLIAKALIDDTTANQDAGIDSPPSVTSPQAFSIPLENGVNNEYLPPLYLFAGRVEDGIIPPSQFYP